METQNLNLELYVQNYLKHLGVLDIVEEKAKPEKVVVKKETMQECMLKKTSVIINGSRKQILAQTNTADNTTKKYGEKKCIRCLARFTCFSANNGRAMEKENKF